MDIFLLILAPILTYLLVGANPAIILSRAVYGKDIRECGSGNPGFTNFKRTFGNKLAYAVFAADLVKSILPAIVFGLLLSDVMGSRQIAVAYVGAFAMLGHSYPVWYGFRGGKGFLVLMGLIFVADWRAGLIAFAILTVLLLTLKYMSLATMVAVASAPVSMALMGCESVWAIAAFTLFAAFMVLRHKENIVRLVRGTESKFSFSSKKTDK